MDVRYVRLGITAALALSTLGAVATPTAALAPAPTVTSLAPHRADNDDRPLVAISGTGFAAGSTVTFGGEPAVSTDVRTSTLIYARPPSLHGTVDIRVTTGGQQSPVTAKDKYTITTPPETPFGDQGFGFGRLYGIFPACASDGYCLVLGRRHAVSFQGDVRGPQLSVPPFLVASACTSATFCAAVSSDHAYVLRGQHWTGSARLRALTGPVAVACPAPTACFAVSTGGVWWRYDGTRWTSERGGPRAAKDYNIDLSCASASFCVAGVGFDGQAEVTRLSHFDGSAWTIRAAYSGNFERETRVSCTSATYCFAATVVGDQEWNGSTWHTVTASPKTRLRYVRCFAAHACLGTGMPRPGVRADHLMRFDGTRWTDLGEVPNAGLAYPTVGCWSLSTCRSATDVDYSKVWHASSGWGPAQELGDRLYHGIDVSCAAAGPFCVAVNDLGKMGVWDDGAWRPAVRIDHVGSPTAVSCTHGGRCVVVDDVGYAITVTRAGDVLSALRVDTKPLNSVSCSSAEFCVATDTAGRVVRFEGGTWHTPTQRAPAGTLRAISCTSPNFCLAVGHGYVVRYKGSADWTAAKKIATYTGAVSCTSASYCMVGVRTGIRIWGGQAFSPELSFDWFHNIMTISCPVETYCFLRSMEHASQTYYTALDGAAHAYQATLGSSSDMSCWAPRRCFLLQDGDHVETTR